MGILNKFGKNKSGAGAPSGDQDTMAVMEDGVDPRNFDISDDEFREGISQYYQAAENYLNEEKKSPKIAAASMKLLEIHLKDSYLVKGIYQSIEAKNQVNNFSQSVRQHCERMFSKLSQSDNAEVNKIVSVSKQLIDETYYVDNYEIANDLREANVRVTELKSRNSLGISIVQVGVFILFLVCLFYLVLAPMDDGSDVMKYASIAGAVIFIAIFGVSLFWQKKLAFGKSRRIIRKYGDILDFERFNQLDQLFDGNYEQAALMKDQHQKIVDQFFYQSGQGGAAYPAESQVTSQAVPEPAPVIQQTPQAVPQPVNESFSAAPAETPVVEEDFSAIFSGIDLEDIAVGKPQQETVAVQQKPVEVVQPAAEVSPQIDQQPAQQKQVADEEKVVIAFCMMCGTKVKENAVFCPNCGSRLEL